MKTVRRNYRGDTLVLETIFETDDGEAALIDFMPIKEQTGQVEVIRLVEGRKGSVCMRMELILRFDYGEIVPWVRYTADGIRSIAGPDAVLVSTPVETHGEDLKTVARFAVSKGERLPFILTRYDSYLPLPQVYDPLRLLNENEAFWEKWISGCAYNGPFRKQVVRSLITLKALTYRPTAAIVAAPTTSLPERLGGPLNWDYRYCWLRDGTFALTALLASGYRQEATAWQAWFMRAVAGNGRKLQTMYGLAGERRLKEFDLPHLRGYEGSQPV